MIIEDRKMTRLYRKKKKKKKQKTKGWRADEI